MVAYRLHFEEVNLRRRGPGAPRAHRRAEVLQLVVLDDRAPRRHPDQARARRRHALRHRRLLHQRRPLPVSRGAPGGAGRLGQRRRRHPGGGGRVHGRDPAIQRRARGVVCHQLQCRRRGGLSHRRHQGPPARGSGLRVRRGPRVHAHRQRQGDAQAHRQARSVRAGTAALLRLHPARPQPGALGRRRAAGRAHRAGAVRIGRRPARRWGSRPTAKASGRPDGRRSAGPA